VKIDPITLEVFNHRLAAIAEEMGVALCRSAFSPNIKERRDFSCALFDGAGEMVAQAAHIPVHLGSTPMSVRAAMRARTMEPGDVIVLNDPFNGGTHLPDVTVVAPVFLRGARTPFGYVANRAHHADIGGSSPGSMPLATEIYEEGLRLPPVHLVRGGEICADVADLFFANTRVPDERRGDLLAQLAALRVGATRLEELVAASGEVEVRAAMAALQDYAARLMTAALRQLRPGRWEAEDFLDDDGVGTDPIVLRVAVELRAGRATVDCRGTAAQVEGGVNSNVAVTTAAVLYCLQLLAGTEIPANAGLLRPLRILIPEGSLLNPRFPAAVAGGNVETSQRTVDVVLRALAAAAPDRVPAASGGTMNNLALGGYDPGRGRAFAYYETIACGAGAGPQGPGASGIHTHMTNTLNTPVEALEAAYPLRVVRYGLRRGSGGAGRHRGGDGIEREIEVLGPMRVTLLTDRRRIAPWGLAGGAAGKTGENHVLVRGRGSRWKKVAGKTSLRLQAGDRVRLRTPGGGGWGRR
jgi:N-methylhydantoinase B